MPRPRRPQKCWPETTGGRRGVVAGGCASHVRITGSFAISVKEKTQSYGGPTESTANRAVGSGASPSAGTGESTSGYGAETEIWTRGRGFNCSERLTMETPYYAATMTTGSSAMNTFRLRLQCSARRKDGRRCQRWGLYPPGDYTVRRPRCWQHRMIETTDNTIT